MEVIENSIEKVFPSKKLRNNKYNIPKNVKKLFRNKKKIYDKILKCRSPHSLRVLRNKLEGIEAQISKNYNDRRNLEESKVIEDMKNDPKKFYKYAKKHSKTREEIGPLQDRNGNIFSDNKKMADMLLEQYRSVFSEPVSDSFIYNHIDYMCDIMPEEIFTEEKIMKHINKLNNNSSPGPDGISSLCYKKGGQIILDSLIDIYTQMYN